MATLSHNGGPLYRVRWTSDDGVEPKSWSQTAPVSPLTWLRCRPSGGFDVKSPLGKTQSGKGGPGRYPYPPPPPAETRKWWISFTWVAREVVWTVEGCLGRSLIRTALRVHFMQHHVWDTIVVLEEGNQPHPQCPRCDIFFPWEALNSHQPSMKICANWT